MINISLCGEHTISTQSLARLLQDEQHFNVLPVRVNQTPTQCLNECRQQDVIVYCVNGYSSTLIKELKKSHKDAPQVNKVLVMSMAHKHFIKKLFETGVKAIISYKASPEELIQAVKYASLNQQYLSPEISQMVVETSNLSSFNSLSRRELEVTYMLANGMNVKNVSSELDISPKTVNTYRYRIFSKLSIDRNIDLYRIVSQEASYMLNK